MCLRVIQALRVIYVEVPKFPELSTYCKAEAKRAQWLGAKEGAVLVCSPACWLLASFRLSVALNSQVFSLFLMTITSKSISNGDVALFNT